MVHATRGALFRVVDLVEEEYKTTSFEFKNASWIIMSPKDRLEKVQGHLLAGGSTVQNISGAAAVLKALQAAGITHLFVNLGSDHPAFIAEFVSRDRHAGLQIFTSPNEMNALSAASGFAQITGRPAAVLVHVECGTQGLAGAVHNVSKGRIPALILAGTVPATMEGELAGSRNEYVLYKCCFRC